MAEKRWDDDGKAFDIDPNLLGRIGNPEEICGHLTERAAEELGLTTKTKGHPSVPAMNIPYVGSDW